MESFVRVLKGHACASWGVGKLIEIVNKEATVSWFDSPISSRQIRAVPFDQLERVILERQSRVYWLDRSKGVWRVGRILEADNRSAEVRFSNRQDRCLPIGELEIRWDHPIDEPSAFLAERINESPLFAEARTRFSQSLIKQRGGSGGMSGLLSSVIDLERHQFEVVKRVLQDPVQRYLLADEVGLGKTIEAGALIRQYVLDDPQEHRVLVIVPAALVVQWRRELRKRFLLGDLLDYSLRIIAIDAGADRLLDALRWARMAVIDEAHHLSHEPKLYTRLRETIIAVPRLLLLSATPVLHNERGFLEMLHLLDPHVYRLEDETAFRQRIEHRQALAESVAGLAPENLFQIEDFLEDLTKRFSDDSILMDLAASLRAIVLEFPDASNSRFVNALTRLRAHLTETYRLDRRILRNRRRDLQFLTPHRAGLERVEYQSTYRARLIQAAEAWRSAAAESVYTRESSDSARLLGIWFRDLLAAIFTDAGEAVRLVRKRSHSLAQSPLNAELEQQLLVELEDAALACASESNAIDALLAFVDRELHSGSKLIIFCTQPSVADTVASRLKEALAVRVDRHACHEDPEEDTFEKPWERFLSDPAHQVLVCDAAAEEGLNLQGGTKILVHFDLPLEPNRVEQRLGRADRYGSGEAIRSAALYCENDSFAKAWTDYLDLGLELFNRSVASLQYLIDDEMQALREMLLIEGVDALSSLTERIGGEQGSAARELRRIDDQDALDALTLRDETSLFDDLTDVDSDWRDISDGVQRWMVDILQIEQEATPLRRSLPFGYSAFRFCFSYGENRSNTLIPLKRVINTLRQLLDIEARGAHSKLLKTSWYTCRRESATASSAQTDGIRLVRWGETLVDRIQSLMDLDDRGRAAAMWRHARNYELHSDSRADTYLRFDFIVETDTPAALQATDQDPDSVFERALARRGDMALAPFYKTLWLDEELSLVSDLDLLTLLEAPYRKERGNHAYQDWNLNAERWPLLDGLNLRTVGDWQQWILRARQAAESVLRRETDLETLCERAISRARELDEARFAQLRARIRYAGRSDSEATATLLAREQRVADALYTAIRTPRITLGTVVAIFVSPHPMPGAQTPDV